MNVLVASLIAIALTAEPAGRPHWAFSRERFRENPRFCLPHVANIGAACRYLPTSC